MMRMMTILAAALLATGCPNEAARRTEDRTMSRGDESLRAVTTMDDVRRHAGERARIEGRYEVTPIAGSKRLQPAVIVLADGERLIRSYRPRPEEYRFLDKRVVIVGIARTDAGQPSNVQQVMAPHIEPETIELAPGETPWPTPPTELPSPPLVSRAQDFRGLHDRWVRIAGVLTSVTERPNDSFWSDAVYTLPDGTRVSQAGVATSRWKKHQGTEVTVVARAWIDNQDGVSRYSLTGISEICPGRVERCGMR